MNCINLNKNFFFSNKSRIKSIWGPHYWGFNVAYTQVYCKIEYEHALDLSYKRVWD